jgi:hypothetical protein
LRKGSHVPELSVEGPGGNFAAVEELEGEDSSGVRKDKNGAAAVLFKAEEMRALGDDERRAPEVGCVINGSGWVIFGADGLLDLVW